MRARSIFASLPAWIGLTVLASGLPVAAGADGEAAERAASNQLYTEAEQALESGQHDRALSLFQQYLDFTRSRSHRPERVFWAIDRVAYLQLGVKRNPGAALVFFERMRTDPRLSDIDRGAIEEWIEVAKEWKAEDTHNGIRDAVQLFERGKRYFESGLEKENTGIAFFAHSDLHIASGYLRRFAILHDGHPRIGDVLYMLGAIRFHTRADETRWADNFYLKESIRRFPHSAVAARSYDLLRRETGRVYRSSEIPEELAESLEVYGQLALAPAAPAA